MEVRGVVLTALKRAALARLPKATSTTAAPRRIPEMAMPYPRRSWHTTSSPGDSGLDLLHLRPCSPLLGIFESE